MKLALIGLGKMGSNMARRAPEIWQYRSGVRSWLLGLIIAALKEDPEGEAAGGLAQPVGRSRCI